MSKLLKINKAELKQSLNNVIFNAQKALELSPSNAPEEIAVDVPVQKTIYVDPKKIGRGRMHFLYNFIDAQIKGDNEYINTRPISTYELVINAAKSVLASNDKLASVKNIVVNSSESQVKDILQIVLQRATDGLKRAKEKELSLKAKSIEPKIPAPIEIGPQIVKPQQEPVQKVIPVSEKVLPASGPWPEYPSEEQENKIVSSAREQLATIKFSNETTWLVTVLLPNDSGSYDLLKLYPHKDSNAIALFKNDSKPFAIYKDAQILIYLMGRNYVLTPETDKVILAIETISNQAQGRYVDYYSVLERPISFSFKRNKQPIVATIKADRSIHFTQENY